MQRSARQNPAQKRPIKTEALNFQISLKALNFVGSGKAKAGIRHALKIDEELKSSKAKKTLGRPKKQKPLVMIHSSKGMNLNFARCCCPIPGDRIKGFYNAAHKIIIHVSHCEHLENLIKQNNHGKWVEVQWSPEIYGFFSVRLTVTAQSSVGVIAGITREIAELGGNIREFNMHETLDLKVYLEAVVEVQDRTHLAKMMRSIKHLTYVKRVHRGPDAKE